ncbi:carbon-nitrogen hydrolase family protein [uncultured Dokdonia sp.]|uniref:carbon-nitrogen hydrolase family protein n=1 Tax=Dokdonia sp. R78006 TaxID=3093866 RepID=UPI00260B91EA|nr:carbon-nitrogen hydrolase family protein [uncultured Dokdonia sp.]
MSKPNHLKVALAQIAPVWGNREETIKKIKIAIQEAVENEAELIVFGEGLLPGYPYWLSLTDGAAWDTKVVKELHAHYARNAVDIERGDLDEICALSKHFNIAIYLGIIEKPMDRGGASLYCSLVYINENGEIQSVHRKLQPTYDERLTWAPGDGHGLKVHPLKQFTVGGLNCWENWMPLPRAAMYAQGENLHIAVWPGSDYNTKDITRFIARESRSYVISVSSRMAIATDFPEDTPHLNEILKRGPERSSNGGSCIAGPDGEFILPPDIETEGNIYHTLDFNRVYEERQNFDPSGHYSRPDVTKLTVNRERQSTVTFND